MLNFELLIPELTLAGVAIIVILLDLVVPRKGVLPVVSIAGVVVAAGFTIAALSRLWTRCQPGQQAL